MQPRGTILLALSAGLTPVLSSPVHADTLGSLRPILSARQRNVQDEFHGKGRVLVINSDTYMLQNPLDKLLGCINADGKVIPVTNADKSACEVFDKSTLDYRDKIISPAGKNCTFHNKLQPANVDSYYGRNSYAFYCGKTEAADWETGWKDLDHFYTVNGFYHPYICNGNLACYYDMKEPPQGRETNFDPMDIWVFYWGGHEMDGVKGHLMVLLMWDPNQE